MMHWYGDGGPGGWEWVLMVACMIVFWGVLIGVGVAWYRRQAYAARPRPTADGTQLSPEQILARRYAQGEIDESEYSTQLAALRRALRP
jgi:putative membrane protein